MPKQLITPETVQKALYVVFEWLNDKSAGYLSNALKPKLEFYDAVTNSFVSSYPTEEWTKNSRGMVHGGIISTMLDTSMGALTFCAAGEKMTPAISM